LDPASGSVSPKAIFFVPSAIADTVLPLLDGYAAVAKKVG